MSRVVIRTPCNPIRLEVVDDGDVCATVEVDDVGDVSISDDVFISASAAKALAAAILQACEEHEKRKVGT